MPVKYTDKLCPNLLYNLFGKPTIFLRRAGDEIASASAEGWLRNDMQTMQR